MKIDKIYARRQTDGRCFVIARIKRDGQFVIEEIEVSPERYKKLREGDTIGPLPAARQDKD